MMASSSRQHHVNSASVVKKEDGMHRNSGNTLNSIPPKYAQLTPVATVYPDPELFQGPVTPYRTVSKEFISVPPKPIPATCSLFITQNWYPKVGRSVATHDYYPERFALSTKERMTMYAGPYYSDVFALDEDDLASTKRTKAPRAKWNQTQSTQQVHKKGNSGHAIKSNPASKPDLKTVNARTHPGKVAKKKSLPLGNTAQVRGSKISASPTAPKHFTRSSVNLRSTKS
jgi:hypothetical protein